VPRKKREELMQDLCVMEFAWLSARARMNEEKAKERGTE
jgi:hypothetical protein